MKLHEMSKVAREVLDAEEIENAALVNRVRYIFSLMFLGPVLYISIKSNIIIALVANSITMIVYLIITIIHTFILRRGNINKIRGFNYVAVVSDFLVILGAILFWGLYLAPNNFAFTAKTSGWFIVTMIIVITVLQFQTRIVYFALAIFLVSYAAVLVTMFIQGVQVTSNWLEYINGPAIDAMDLIAMKPIVIIAISLVVAHSIKKSLNMVQKISSAETKRALLSRYFSPSVVEDITSNPEEIATAKRQKATILFLDIRNFTQISERLESEVLVDWLSDFRRRLTAIIFKFNGTVDKFIGDAILATFGTPHPSGTPGEDSTNAVHCALEMHQALEELNAHWAKENILTEMGIGIHTGEVFAGNIGDSDQIEYTVIGDPVNTASRIESLCKTLERNLIISSEVEAELDDKFIIEKLAKVNVKGKEEPLQLYHVQKVAT